MINCGLFCEVCEFAQLAVLGVDFYFWISVFYLFFLPLPCQISSLCLCDAGCCPECYGRCFCPRSVFLTGGITSAFSLEDPLSGGCWTCMRGKL